MKITRFIFCIMLCATIQNALGQDKESNKKVARFYIEEIVNKQKPELLNKVFADTFLVQLLADSSQKIQTITGLAEFLKYLFKAFPDIHYTVQEIIGEEDNIAMRVTLSATHKDEFWGYKALNNHIDYLSEIFFFKFNNARVVESRVQIDLYNLFRQLKGEN